MLNSKLFCDLSKIRLGMCSVRVYQMLRLVWFHFSKALNGTKKWMNLANQKKKNGCSYIKNGCEGDKTKNLQTSAYFSIQHRVLSIVIKSLWRWIIASISVCWMHEKEWRWWWGWKMRGKIWDEIHKRIKIQSSVLLESSSAHWTGLKCNTFQHPYPFNQTKSTSFY